MHLAMFKQDAALETQVRPPKRFSTLLIESLQRGKITLLSCQDHHDSWYIHIHMYQYLLKYIAVDIPDTARYINIHHTSSFIYLLHPLTSKGSETGWWFQTRIIFQRFLGCIEITNQLSTAFIKTARDVFSVADFGIILGQHWIVWRLEQCWDHWPFSESRTTLWKFVT